MRKRSGASKTVQYSDKLKKRFSKVNKYTHIVLSDQENILPISQVFLLPYSTHLLYPPQKTNIAENSDQQRIKVLDGYQYGKKDTK